MGSSSSLFGTTTIFKCVFHDHQTKKELHLLPCRSEMLMQDDSDQNCVMDELPFSVYHIKFAPCSLFVITSVV